MSVKHDYLIGATFWAHDHQPNNTQRTEVISAVRVAPPSIVIVAPYKTPARHMGAKRVKEAKKALLARANEMIDGLLASKRAGVKVDPIAIQNAERILRAALARV
jgi:hypothetical protein